MKYESLRTLYYKDPELYQQEYDRTEELLSI